MEKGRIKALHLLEKS